MRTLYPIATLQAGYRFGVGTPYTGSIIPAEADYTDIGERLMLDVRHDFTFVHSHVLDERGVLNTERAAAGRSPSHPRDYGSFFA